MLIAVCFSFFFFKQKTAYEMRISDWSSDVCSSDLIEKVVAELAAEAGRADAAARALLSTLTAPPDLDALRRLGGSETLLAGVEELREVVAGLKALGMPEEAYRVDLTIARGLDYYTGTVYETQLVDNPEIGSVCSGGRYDDLASNYTRQKLPGVGISIGLTRLLSRLFEAGLLKPEGQTPATVLVTTMDRRFLADYLAIAAELRDRKSPRLNSS